ncbi:hypothetical protein RE628_17430 [Paenibacillus sp. D2_2]|uniref:hypothetical protein n=1 Tax=Paenibacillus sp. D2_2 TaxID=3073092 RepID=UPI002814B845|nr:hypothetical protein [Paenibacillus sp. D2_2]WMT39238.1 hypothetical protein RE628_17430 [Paenibacillus sp. D2_2]
MQGIVIRDNYVHDVNGLHQANGASKISGGIIVNGYVDVLIEGNKTLRCDNEGIRNNAYGPSSAGQIIQASLGAIQVIRGHLTR